MSKQYAANQPQGYNNHFKNIAIVGAGGQVGKYITKYLLKEGKHNLTAITRKGSKTKPSDGITTKEVDYDDPSTIVDALKGQDCLVITLGVTAPQGTHDKLVKAAADAKVPWIFPNEWGTHPAEDVGREVFIGPGKKKERDYIETVGVSWTAVTSGFWYEFSLAGAQDRYGFDLKNRSVIFFDEGEVKMNTTTWEQTGRAAAGLLNLKLLPDDENDTSACLDHFRNKFFHVSSFCLSQKDMFASILRVTDTKESDWKISHEPVKERFEAARKEAQQGNYSAFARVLYSRMFFPDAPQDFSDRVDNEVLGLPKEDLDEVTKYAIKLEEEGFFAAQHDQWKRSRGN